MAIPPSSWRAPRSWLYVPASDVHKLRKASELVADAVILDLEDAVAPDAKDEARATLVEALSTPRWRPLQVWVRVNPPRSAVDWVADVRVAAIPQVTGLVIPKASDPAIVEAVAGELDRTGAETLLAPIVTEEAAGVVAMRDTMAVSSRVIAAFWGTEDLAADLGLAAPRVAGRLDETLAYVRGAFLIACRVAGVAAVDTPWLAITDLEGLTVEATRSFRGGFTGMQAIHPAHVDVIDRAFTPSDAEVEHARDVLRRAQIANGAATRLGDQMIDAPHVRIAQRVLDRAEGRGAR